MDPPRRYSESEVARILERATVVDDSTGPTPASADGLTLAELEDIGREVGIPAERIVEAASTLDVEPAARATDRRLLGLRVGVGRTVYLDRSLSDSEWARLVVDLRETFDARGRISEEGVFRQWTNGNLQALLEPTETGERLRLKTVKGSAIASMRAGTVLLSVAAVLLVISAVTGGIGDPGTLVGPLTIGAVGLFLMATRSIGLPKWAATRELQMEGVAARLAAATAGPAAETDRED